MNDKRFPKAKLIKVEFCPPVKIGKKIYLRPMYNRMSNAARLFIPFLCLVIIWRMPWLPMAAFQMGWDSCWRQQNGLEP